jgi:hypothetical protein
MNLQEVGRNYDNVGCRAFELCIGDNYKDIPRAVHNTVVEMFTDLAR